MKKVDMNEHTRLAELDDSEIAQISGAIAPIVLLGIWTAGGALLEFAGAAAAHYWGNGNHNH